MVLLDIDSAARRQEMALAEAMHVHAYLCLSIFHACLPTFILVECR